MGIQDLQKLFEINQQIKQFDKKKYYNFIMDTDTKEGKTNGKKWKRSSFESSRWNTNLRRRQ